MVFSLSPFSMPILYGLVFKPFLGRVTIWSSISILYGLAFKSFLGRVTIWFSISILYGLAFKSFLGRVAVFISICIYYSHISLSPFGRTSLSSNDFNGISRTIFTSLKRLWLQMGEFRVHSLT